MAGIVWWTAPRLAALRKLMAGGVSYRVAAAIFSGRYRRRITRAAVEGICRAQGWRGSAPGGRPRLRA
jgi:hypothetical protein